MARNVGGWIGRLLGTAVNIYAGYVWAKHGPLWAFAVVGAALVVGFAVWGALHYPWRSSDEAE